MTRCLLVTNIFPPLIGGPATFMEATARTLTELGHRVTVVCSSERPIDESDRARPYRVRRIDASSPYRYHLEVRRVLLAELSTHSRVLVNGLDSFVYPIARLLRRSYVLKVVGDTVWEAARNAGRTTLDIDEFQVDQAAQHEFRGQIQARNRVVRHAHCILTPSDYLRGVVVNWGIPPERVTTIPNGIEHVCTAPRAEAQRLGPLEVVFVGRLTNWKGVETLLLALSGLDGVRATIVGDGPELPHLVELGRQLGLGEQVRFLGRQPRGEVAACMARSHVLVLTSLYEGLSHTLLEAMALGLACIASARGGNGEVVTSGQNGLLIPPQDVRALRGALQRLRDDDGGRRAMGRAAFHTSARFSILSTVNMVARILLEGHGLR